MLPAPLRSDHADHPAARWAANAEILQWQSVVRFRFVLLAGGLSILLRILGHVSGPVADAVLVMGGYAASSGGLAMLARRTREARSWLLLAMFALDIAFLFSYASLVDAPAYYSRTLLFAFAIVAGAEYYFGPRLAMAVIAMTAAAYVALVQVARARGAALPWGEELWSLASFALTAGLFVVMYGGFRERLARLARLFEQVEDGDFSGEYDVARDRHPDAITAVGRAYNRVRGQLATMVLTDPLSGCLNRRGLEGVLRREVARAARARTELSLLVLDVDDFKRINDAFGHLAGDAVIQELGGVLRETVRAGDVVARLGGDEFAILLPETAAAGAFHLAGRVREAVHQRAFAGVEGRLPITVSVGMVSDIVRDGDMARALYARADEALYAAKAGGRNRVSIWTEGTKAPAGVG